MRIGINAQLLAFGGSYRQAGVSNYIYHIVRDVPPLDPGNQYFAFVGDGRALQGLSSPNLAGVVSALPTGRPPARIFWEQAFQPLSLRAHDVDLIHCPMHVVPFLSGRRKVVTVHDLAFLAFPETHKRGNRLYLTMATRWSLAQAERIIAVSESTRREICKRLKIPAAKITVVHNGVDSRFQPRPADEVQEFRERLGLPERFVLFVGTLEPRKNIEALARAFAHAKADLAKGTSFVLAGGKGWAYGTVFPLIDRLGIREDVLIPGFVPDADLPLWYAAATVFVYPSLYEGFGLPPLEAMACGTPVVASNTSSLPEVVGDAGILVDPGDCEALANAIANLLTDPSLCDILRRKGIQRARQFSWRLTAGKTKQVYSDVLATGR